MLRRACAWVRNADSVVFAYIYIYIYIYTCLLIEYIYKRDVRGQRRRVLGVVGVGDDDDHRLGVGQPHVAHVAVGPQQVVVLPAELWGFGRRGGGGRIGWCLSSNGRYIYSEYVHLWSIHHPFIRACKKNKNSGRNATHLVEVLHDVGLLEELVLGDALQRQLRYHAEAAQPHLAMVVVVVCVWLVGLAVE